MNQYMTPELYSVMPEIIEAATAPLQDTDHYIHTDVRKNYVIRQPRATEGSYSWR